MKHRLQFPFVSLLHILPITQHLLQYSSHAWTVPSPSIAIRASTLTTASSSSSSTSTSTSTSLSSIHTPNNDNENDRRTFISQIATLSASSIPILIPQPSIANAEEPTSEPTSSNNNNDENVIFTAGYGREEYTNSITASRDTNISPKEVYDSIRSSYISYPLEQLQKKGDSRMPRAFDVGAGAGVSTQTLYLMGYKSIEAVDWSSKAWDENVDEKILPNTINFHPVDDERFLEEGRKNKAQGGEGIGLFDVIVFNFGINDSKAKSYANKYLQPDGRLLAPVNTQSDYWLKQAFKVYDCKGELLWTANDIGAWSVQFQPDVTQDTCQGIWCAPYNGFQKKR